MLLSNKAAWVCAQIVFEGFSAWCLCWLVLGLAVVLLCLQVRDDNLAFVQTCWTFINSDSLLTWAQKVGLDFHFAVEQRARSFLGHFFNFNGTAGVCLLPVCWS
jgi:hypothetical protein